MIDKQLLLEAARSLPDELLEHRLETEANVCACLFNDLTLLDDGGFDPGSFITQHGRILFSVAKEIRDKGHNVFDEVTMLSNLSELALEKIQTEIGGFQQIQNLMDIVDTRNWDSYSDALNKANVIINLHNKGFDVLSEITLDNGKVSTPIKLFKKFTTAQVIEWYESQLSSLSTKVFSTKIVDDTFVDFDDAFIESLENQEDLGVDFGDAGENIDGEKIHTFEFLSRQIMGFKTGTLSAFAAASGVGKSTWLVGMIMSLISKGGHKVCLVSNETQAKDIKIQFLSFFCSRYLNEWGITKTKLISGNLTNAEKDTLRKAKTEFRERYMHRIKIVTLADADTAVTCQIIKNAILREGCDIFCVDTFKLTMDSGNAENFWLSLVKDTRTLTEIALRYDVIGLMTVQLAINSQNRSWLGAESLSQSKAIKEVLSNLILIRQAYPELEFNPNSPYFIRPFRSKYNENTGEWYEEPYEPDPKQAYRIIFIDKSRRGVCSADNGICYLSRFDAEHSSFFESAKCRPSHKMFNSEGTK